MRFRYARRGPFATEVRRNSLSPFALGMAYFAVTAKAVEANVRNDCFSALRDYVLSIDTKRKSTDAIDAQITRPDRDLIDAAYATLRAFAAQNGVEQPPSTAGPDEIGRCRQPARFLASGRLLCKPSVAPQRKGPVAGGTQPSAPVEATYVGAKVCMTCHASQAEAVQPHADGPDRQ